jgi:Flp pilus assembly protein CpaB
MNRISLIIKQRMLSIIFITIAVIGGIVIFWYIGSLKEKIPSNLDYNLVFVAGTDIKKGEEIIRGSIEAQKIPANIFSEKFIIDEDEIIGKKVAVDISEGEIITKEKLEGVDSSNDFSPTFSSYIPYDLRAVSIPVNFYGDKSLLEAGDSIDLISTYYEQESGVLYSETVLSEKEIILIGDSHGESYLGDENDRGSFLLDPVIADSSTSSNYGNLLVITFYLSKSEVEEIFLALERGVINLSVCPKK